MATNKKLNIGRNKKNFFILLCLFFTLNPLEGVQGEIIDNDYIFRNLAVQLTLVCENFYTLEFRSDEFTKRRELSNYYLQYFLTNNSEYNCRYIPSGKYLYDKNNNQKYEIIEWDIGQDYFIQGFSCQSMNAEKFYSRKYFPNIIYSSVNYGYNNFNIISKGLFFKKNDSIKLVSGFMLLDNIQEYFSNLFKDTLEVHNYISIRYYNYSPHDICIKYLAKNYIELTFKSEISKGLYSVIIQENKLDKLTLLHNAPNFHPTALGILDYYLHYGIKNKIDSVDIIWDDKPKRISTDSLKHFYFN